MNLREDPAPSGRDTGAPLDHGFLARQCMGDAALQREILGLFLTEARRMRGDIARAGQTLAETADKAHRLKGSALAVGAGARAPNPRWRCRRNFRRGGWGACAAAWSRIRSPDGQRTETSFGSRASAGPV